MNESDIRDMQGRMPSSTPRSAMVNSAKISSAKQIAAIKSQWLGFTDILLCRAPWDTDTGLGHFIRLLGAWGCALAAIMQFYWVLFTDGHTPVQLLVSAWFWWLSLRLFYGVQPGLALVLDTVLTLTWGPWLLSNMFLHNSNISLRLPIEVSVASLTNRMTQPPTPAACPPLATLRAQYATILVKTPGDFTATDFAPKGSGSWVNCNQSRKLLPDEVVWCSDTTNLAALANTGKRTAEFLISSCYRQ